MRPPPKAAIIGGGPAGLMAADVLSQYGFEITLFERMPSVGRKFLLAGRGGLNLTHSEPIELFMSRYGSARLHLEKAIAAFSPEDLRRWCEGLGQSTFVGSSGRIFPYVMKASPLLRAWLKRLLGRGVVIKTRHLWTGWDAEKRLTFTDQSSCQADVTLLALGGMSWPQLGSDGGWLPLLPDCAITPFSPANGGMLVNWSETFKTRFAGQPLKSVALTCAGETLRSEIMISLTGLEGTGIYAMGPLLRKELLSGPSLLHLDLRPDVSTEALEARFLKTTKAGRRKESFSNFLRKATGLSPPAIGLVHECAFAIGRPASSLPLHELCGLIKAAPVLIKGTAPIARAISTAGGLCFSNLDERWMLRPYKGVFVAGEMLDWEAPTGGYLLQACLATGWAAAHGIVDYMGSLIPPPSLRT
jgi:uncharacterized flavoprotein (TIGR03862 family)